MVGKLSTLLSLPSLPNPPEMTSPRLEGEGVGPSPQSLGLTPLEFEIND